MAFLSIHTMEGDPDDLLARKHEHMDPASGLPRSASFERFVDADYILYQTP